MNRRSFFEQTLQYITLSVMSLLTIFGIFPDLISEKRKQKKVVLGKEDEVFRYSRYITKQVDEQTFIVKQDDRGNINAFDARCTHAGCRVEWNESNNSFLCKCHGGIFDSDGKPVSGPPKEPLKKVPLHRRANTNELIIYLGDDSA